jgi:hypothetical protein
MIAAANACNNSTNYFINTLINSNMSSDDKAKAISSYTPAVCDVCTAKNIDMNMTISINASLISNNNIANEIQAGLKSKIDEMINQKQSGVIGYGKAQVKSLKNIKSIIHNKFNTNIVNETLNQMTLEQSITSENSSLKNISQNMAATMIASSLLDNALKNNSGLQNDIDLITKHDNSNIGALDSLGKLFSGIFNSWFVILIFPIIFILIVGYYLMSGGSGGYNFQQSGQNFDQNRFDFDQNGFDNSQYI